MTAAPAGGPSRTMLPQHHRAISPPTPAPSPQPETRQLRQDPSSLLRAEDEVTDFGAGLGEGRRGSALGRMVTGKDGASPLIKLFSLEFGQLGSKDRHAFLAHLIEACTARELAELSSLISPRLKVDFLSTLPIEVSLDIVSYLDDPRTLARASCVSRFWRSLVNDEHTWKVMCARYRFRQLPTSLTSASAAGEDITGGQSRARTRTVSSTETELAPGLGSLLDSTEAQGSSNVLASLFEAYRARGLDAAAALAELKTLHELFLTKRAREMGLEERRRQLHALHHDGEILNLIQDREFMARMAETNMRDEDKQFYRQLEELVREHSAQDLANSVSGAASHGFAHPNSSHRREHGSMSSSRDAADAPVGWLSTGPPQGQNQESGPAVPSTPTDAPRVAHLWNAAPIVPVPEAGRALNSNLVSPTSRLGSMTSGLLTSLWDRAGASSANTSETGHPPSAGDHGHSAEGHTNDEDEEMQLDDQQHTSVPTASEQAQSTRAASEPATELPQARLGGMVGKGKTRTTARQGKEARDSNLKSENIGMGHPTLPQSRLRSGQRSVTVAATESAGADFSPADVNSSAADASDMLRRSASSFFDGMPSARRGPGGGKPFSYKTHFKLAYLTESNWLRGGRLLTQHVSSGDASPESTIVTSLSIDDEWIVVGMTNAKIHVFDARTGLFVKTLTGHSSGVWCLSLISASSPFGSMSRSSKMQGTAKDGSRDLDNAERMEEDGFPASSVGAYPYDSDRPLYTPTPDLNLIHHDPRPSASVFSSDMRAAAMHFSGAAASGDRPSMPAPRSFSGFSQQETQSSGSRPGSIHSESRRSQDSSRPPFSGERAPFTADSSESYSSRGAGLGSNFGSPCGSAAGYGNEHPIVVSSGCDRDVRVWDLITGECKYVLSGHRSTVRCLRVFDGRPIAISGSRDGTMRVWNVETGQQVHLLAGHQHSVRCLDLAGNLVASASYDCTGRIWNVDTGKCVHVLRGHYHQLYAITFDGVHVATGSLDTTVRVWSAETGECLALLQAHISLVGQLQLTDSTLVTGGSDGKVVVFSLKTMKIMYQLLAHGNSVTCLQFDDRFIVTGGNDGKVKLWNARTGEFVRELCDPADQVWKVSFRDDKCVVLCKRNDKTAIDVISFRPIEEAP